MDVLVAYGPFIPLYVRILSTVYPVLCTDIGTAFVVSPGATRTVGTILVLRHMSSWSNRCMKKLSAQILDIQHHAHLVLFDYESERVEVFDPMGDVISDSVRQFYHTKARSELGVQWVVQFTSRVCDGSQFPQHAILGHLLSNNQKRCDRLLNDQYRLIWCEFGSDRILTRRPLDLSVLFTK
jgi:hypothetical protein